MYSKPAGRRSQRGQVLVIVAGGLIGLIAIAAFALEGGTVMLNRRDAQNSADLASMAGAHIVAQHYTQSAKNQGNVRTAIEDTLGANDCTAVGNVPCTWTAHFVGSGLVDLGLVGSSGPLPAGALGVRVDVTRQPGALLGRILGITDWTISTEGTSITKKPSSAPAGLLVPIAVCGWDATADPNDCAQASASPAPGNGVPYVAGQFYDLTDGKDAPGGFGWIAWYGTNDPNSLANSLCTADNPGFSLDSPYDDPHGAGETWFPGDPGKSNSKGVRDCLDKLIAGLTTVLVPIYDLVEGNGNKAQYHITGVAAFVLDSREQPAVDNIRGRFVEFYPLTDVAAGTSWTPPDQNDTTTFVGLVK
jgi:Flp pilus assembly protein TadG